MKMYIFILSDKKNELYFTSITVISFASIIKIAIYTEDHRYIISVFSLVTILTAPNRVLEA